MGNVINLEKRLTALESKIKKLKVSQAVAGSLIDMHTYTKRIDISGSGSVVITTTFKPRDGSNINNIAFISDMSYRQEYYYGAFGDLIAELPYITMIDRISRENGIVESDEYFQLSNLSSGFADYSKIVTVYANCEGELSINYTVT